MTSVVRLTPRGEALLHKLVATGACRSTEEVIERALEALDEKSEQAFGASSTMTPAEAVAKIVENRKGVTLGGLKIRDLMNEGRKY